ncbi:Cro/Cl family transcriptional regulator, partial [Aliarcobacter butzleri]
DSDWLHGLNAICLKEFGGYKVDAGGNKEGVSARFTPPLEQLAVKLENDELDVAKLYSKPSDVVIEALLKKKTHDEMFDVFPHLSL